MTLYIWYCASWDIGTYDMIMWTSLNNNEALALYIEDNMYTFTNRALLLRCTVP